MKITRLWKLFINHSYDDHDNCSKSDADNHFPGEQNSARRQPGSWTPRSTQKKGKTLPYHDDDMVMWKSEIIPDTNSCSIKDWESASQDLKTSLGRTSAKSQTHAGEILNDKFWIISGNWYMILRKIISFIELS